VDSHRETIGYRRDRQKISGKVKKNLVSAEERKTLVLEMTLYAQDSNRIVYGPIRLSADAEYDYVDGDSLQDLAFIDPSGIQQTVLPFSLGQLEPREAAQEAATRPLNERMARKVIDAIFDVWRK
jgi:hypothetical protein